MFEHSKLKMGELTPLEEEKTNNAKVMTDGRKSEFRPRELKFAIGKVKIWYPARGS